MYQRIATCIYGISVRLNCVASLVANVVNLCLWPHVTSKHFGPAETFGIQASEIEAVWIRKLGGCRKYTYTQYFAGRDRRN